MFSCRGSRALRRAGNGGGLRAGLRAHHAGLGGPESPTTLQDVMFCSGGVLRRTPRGCARLSGLQKPVSPAKSRVATTTACGPSKQDCRVDVDPPAWYGHRSPVWWAIPEPTVRTGTRTEKGDENRPHRGCSALRLLHRPGRLSVLGRHRLHGYGRPGLSWPGRSLPDVSGQTEPCRRIFHPVKGKTFDGQAPSNGARTTAGPGPSDLASGPIGPRGSSG